MSVLAHTVGLLRALALLSLFLALPSTPAPAAEPPEQWAVLIGVQDHDKPAYNLKFTGNDVARLRQTLVERAGMDPRNILQMTDGTEDRKPTLANLRRELPRFLAQAGPEDRVLIFFSGHGVPSGGKTYLVPRDFNLDRAAQCGLAIDEVRQMLGDCKARVKFLILDCCHAEGGGKAPAPGSLPAADVARSVRVQEMPGTVVLASCKAEERSWEWIARKQGVFTYWLCRALEGAAANADGQVTITEVNKYVEERVRQTVEQVLQESQSPVMFGKLQGSPVVLALRPEPPECLCRRLAEHIDLEVRRNKLKKIGVIDFYMPSGRVAQLMAPATLPVFCSDKVREALVSLAAGDYEVLGPDLMKAAAKDLFVEKVGDQQAMRQLGQRAGGLEAVVFGTLQRRGARLHLECELVATADGNSLVKPSGVLPLSEDLVGDTGASFDNRNRPSGKPYDDKVREHAQLKAGEGHPLKPITDPFPYRVELWSIDVPPGREKEIGPRTPRKPMQRIEIKTPVSVGVKALDRIDYVVAARQNQVFEIRVANKSKERVAMTLLVDGINTLGQKRERLGQARSWVLDPEKEHVIAGWYRSYPKGQQPQGGEAFGMSRFVFVDAAKSVAGRQSFGEAIGLITAAFYAERGRALGVGELSEEHRELETAKFQSGRLLGVVQIRYADEAELNK
jgi:hypothetical protein